MVRKIYCDYCEEEITSREHGLEISIVGLTPEERDICGTCAAKVSETLSSITKKKE